MLEFSIATIKHCLATRMTTVVRILQHADQKLLPVTDMGSHIGAPADGHTLRMHWCMCLCTLVHTHTQCQGWHQAPYLKEERMTEDS